MLRWSGNTSWIPIWTPCEWSSIKPPTWGQQQEKGVGKRSIVQYWKKARFFVRSASNFLDQIVFFTKYKKRKKVEVGQHQLLLPVLFPFYSKLEILIGFLLLSPLSRLLLNHKFSQIGFSISTTLRRKKSIWVQFGQRFISCVVRGDGGVGRLQGSRGFTRFRNCCLTFPRNKAINAGNFCFLSFWPRHV